jgi:di/tricarboxylate transporter
VTEQWIVFGVLAATFALFIHGKLPYELVALLGLLVITVSGILPFEDAFLGFGHPAVVTLAAVLVVSRGLLNAGVVNVITRWMGKVGDKPTLQVAALTGLVAFLQVAALTGLVAFLSSFINNVGALALLLPVAIQMARKSGKPPSLLLLPLAFGSLLGA